MRSVSEWSTRTAECDGTCLEFYQITSSSDIPRNPTDRGLTCCRRVSEAACFAAREQNICFPTQCGSDHSLSIQVMPTDGCRGFRFRGNERLAAQQLDNPLVTTRQRIRKRTARTRPRVGSAATRAVHISDFTGSGLLSRRRLLVSAPPRGYVAVSQRLADAPWAHQKKAIPVAGDCCLIKERTLNGQ